MDEGQHEPERGVRLDAQARRVTLLLHHLAGCAVRARVEVDDLLQEVWLRALQAELPPWDPARPDVVPVKLPIFNVRIGCAAT
jgi:DNA-directed RNA polymerase specialized sigma24 family protein